MSFIEVWASYKTTVFGVLSAGASFILFASQLKMVEFPQWAIAVAMFANVGGLAALGITAKDYNAPTTDKEVLKAISDSKTLERHDIVDAMNTPKDPNVN